MISSRSIDKLKTLLTDDEISLLNAGELLSLDDKDSNLLLYLITKHSKTKEAMASHDLQTRSEFVSAIHRLTQAGLSLKQFMELYEYEQRDFAFHADVIIFLLKIGVELQKIREMSFDQMESIIEEVKKHTCAILDKNTADKKAKKDAVNPASYNNCLSQLTNDELAFFQYEHLLGNLIAVPDHHLKRLVKNIITHRTKENEEPGFTFGGMEVSKYLQNLHQLLTRQSHITLLKFSEAADDRQEMLIDYFNEYAIVSRLIGAGKLDQLNNRELKNVLSSLNLQSSKGYNRFCMLTSKSGPNHKAAVAELAHEVDELLTTNQPLKP